MNVERSCTVSKLSAVNRGYYHDDYLRYFVQTPSIRSPIINRGYYARFKAVEYGFKYILNLANQKNQKTVTISLGCGMDTSPFRYREQFFIEIDYPSICEKKSKVIIQNDLIPELIQNKNYDDLFYLIGKHYILAGSDLCDIEKITKIFTSNLVIDQIKKFLDGNPLNLILFNECSLCYMEQNDADRLMKKIMDIFSEKFPNLQINYLGYEMYRSRLGHPGFFEILLGHFQTLKSPILTFIDEDQIRQRFLDKLGFKWHLIMNMRHLFNFHYHNEKRINKIEPFDEWEEFDHICSSYALILAKKQPEPCEENLTRWDVVNPRPLVDEARPLVFETLSVFGHSTCIEGNEISVFGGFGVEPNNSRHGRIQNLIRVHLNGDGIDRISAIKAAKPDMAINRVHCCVVPLGHGEYFLSGGRTSPGAKARPNCIIKIDSETDDTFQMETNDELNYVTMDDGQVLYVPAYRHVCCKFGTDKLIQIGGINSSVPEGKYLVFDLNEGRWFIQNEDSILRDRYSSAHSTAYTEFDRHSVLLHGGFQTQWSTLSLTMVDERERRFQLVNIPSLVVKCYSHRMRWISDNEFVLLGGIDKAGYIRNEMIHFDVRKLDKIRGREDHLPTSNLTLCNFDFEIFNRNIWTIGGGGNFFSFGTHFNPITKTNIDRP